MSPRSVVRLALMMLPLAAGPALGADVLRWKFAEGDIHRYRLEQTNVNAATVQGQEVKTSISQTVDMTWEVVSVESDGSARLAQTIDRVRVSLESQFATFAYDSQDEAAAEGLAAMLKPVVDALAGSRIILVLTPRGEVSDVELPDELVEQLKEAGQAAQALQNLASAEGMKALIGQSTLVLPEEEIAEGDSWSRKVELPTPQGTMRLTNTYTSEGSDEAVATIGVTITIDAYEASPDAPFQMRVEQQDGSGSYTFDTGAGLLRSSELNQTLDLVITVMDQEITSVAESNSSFTLVED